MWEEIISYVDPRLFILIVVLYCLGLFLKLYPKFQAEWTIPFILLGFGVLLCMLWVSVVLGEGFGAPVLIASFGQGIIIAAIAVFGNEAVKQFTKKRLEDVNG